MKQAVAAMGRPPPIVDSVTVVGDAELAARAAAGDRQAFATIYGRLVGGVYARLTRLLGPTSDREDVLQQVFFQVHRSVGAYRGEASLATFVARITIHVAYDHLRQRERRPVPIDQDALDAIMLDASSPELRTQRRQELTRIFGFLHHLTPDKRIAFVLVAIEGLALREVGELVGASPDAVKQRVLHARRELLELIERADRSPTRTS